MKKTLCVVLFLMGVAAQAAETLKTPHGTLGFVENTNTKQITGLFEVTLKGKSLGKTSYSGYPSYLEVHYKLGKQDIYVYQARSLSSGDTTPAYGLVVIEGGKARIVENTEFMAVAHTDVSFEVKGDKLVANLGEEDGKHFQMVYDGKKIAIIEKAIGKKSKKPPLKEESCKDLHESRDMICGHFNPDGGLTPQYLISTIEHLEANYDYNYFGLVDECEKNMEKIENMSYKEFKAKFCSRSSK